MYHSPDTCICCGNDNHTEVKDRIDYLACEIATICFRCGYDDYWAYGYLQGLSTGFVVDYRITWRLNNGRSIT